MSKQVQHATPKQSSDSTKNTLWKSRPHFLQDLAYTTQIAWAKPAHLPPPPNPFTSHTTTYTKLPNQPAPELKIHLHTPLPVTNYSPFHTSQTATRTHHNNPIQPPRLLKPLKARPKSPTDNTRTLTHQQNATAPYLPLPHNTNSATHDSTSKTRLWPNNLPNRTPPCVTKPPITAFHRQTAHHTPLTLPYTSERHPTISLHTQLTIPAQPCQATAWHPNHHAPAANNVAL